MFPRPSTKTFVDIYELLRISLPETLESEGVDVKSLKVLWVWVLLAGCASSPVKRSELVPVADYHQHLMSPAAITPPVSA